MTGEHKARWRVLTWNIHGAARPNLDVVAEVIDGFAPDVVAVQEIRHSQARGLARRNGWRVLWTRKHFPYTPLLWWRAEGMALLSHHAIGEPVSASISPGVSSWTYRHRVMMAATIGRDGARLRVANLHLASDSADDRIAQAARAAALVGERRPVVVAGDLNASGELEIVREFGALGVVDRGGDASSPAIAPKRRLDYVLVPAAATITSRLTPAGGEHWQRLSDHLPVLVEFTLPD